MLVIAATCAPAAPETLAARRRANWAECLRLGRSRRAVGRRLEHLAADGRPVIMLCKTGAGEIERWVLVTRHPETGAWRTFWWDAEGPIGDYAPPSWVPLGYLLKRTPAPSGLLGCLLTAVIDFRGDAATARSTTPQTIDEDLAAIRRAHP